MKRGKYKHGLIAAVLLSQSLHYLPASTPSFLIGFDVGDSLDTPATAATANQVFGGIRGSLNWKEILAREVGWVFRADANLKAVTPTSNLGMPTGYDQERLKLDIFIPTSTGRLNLGGSMTASFLGTASDPIFRLSPEWIVAYHCQDQVVNPFIDVSGRYRVEPNSTGDQTTHSVELGLSIDPDLRWGIALSGLGSLAYFPQTLVLDGSGSPTSQNRLDMALGGSASLTVLPSFLSRLAAGMAGTYWSTNDPYNSRWQIDGNIGISFTPNKQFSFEYQLWDQVELYASAANLWKNTLGGNLHGNWTPDQTWYLYIDLFGNWTRSSDNNLNAWNTGLGLGLEIIF